jgi:predicted alpha/beta superfamily hydrolase
MSSDKSFYLPTIETRLLRSRHVDQEYRIEVMQPLLKRGSLERFPVLYITDGNLSFDLAKAIAQSLQIAGQVQRFILVGICYPPPHPFAGNILRSRDFTSLYRAPIAGLSGKSPIAGVPQIDEGGKTWHGADQFLSFIQDELIPVIDANYPTICADRAYAGFSLGGGLGLHAMFARPDLFKRYLLTSPSIAYDGDEYGIREAQEYIAGGGNIEAKVFLGVGEKEEFDPTEAVARPHFVSSLYRLAAVLRKADFAGLDLTCRIFAGETHASVWSISFTHGIQVIYGPAEQPPLAL